MERRRKERISKIRDIKNNLILDAALTVFSAKGFHSTRLDDIAKEAGFSKAALYNYYKDKENIFFALALREFEKTGECFVEDPSCSISQTNDFTTNLNNYIKSILQTFHSNFTFLLTLDEMQFYSVFNIQENGSPLDEIKRDLFSERKRLREYIINSVNWAKESSEIDSPLSTDRIVSCIEGLLFGVFREWRRKQQAESIDQTTEDLTRFIRHGCQIRGQGN
ncbi:hypothetical protein CHISP_0656 [Chitinispirillum alkaliphilum]|nr:hypothetical protein CHISP_0656 [Chitinispirillum alkaliphilum]